MEDMNVTKALLKAILELIEKCDTLEELRESVKKKKKKTSHRPKQLIFNTEPTASREPYPGRPLF